MDIPEKYAQYFDKLDTPSLITDLNLRIIWKNEAVDILQYQIRRSSSIRYYITKPQFAMLKKLEPGETIPLTFIFDEQVQGFGKKKEDCYIFKISRFNGAAQRRINELFNLRYSDKNAVASSIPAPSENIQNFPVKKMDRLAGIFEGMYTEGLTRMEITTPMKRFAKQATCALAGIEVICNENDKFVYADINVHDLYMYLSGMIVCTLSYAPDVRKLYLDYEVAERNVLIKISCDQTGFAPAIKDVYQNFEKLNTLCEYGAHYLNLKLISAISDHYGWEFNVEEHDSKTSLTVSLSLVWNHEANIVLFAEDGEEDIIKLLLTPFRINSSHQK